MFFPLKSRDFRSIFPLNHHISRATPGLRPAHLAALEALAQLSSATLSGATAGSGQVTFEARPGAEAAAGAAVLVVDAGTGCGRCLDDFGWEKLGGWMGYITDISGTFFLAMILGLVIIKWSG